MKKNVLIFGSISGALITSMMLYSAWQCCTNPGFEGNDVLGYTGLIAAFSFIFVGTRNYREKYNGGMITFGKAFKIGFYISLVASTMYVGAWLIDYYFFVPDFIDKYTAHVLKVAENGGATQAEIDEKTVQMAQFKSWYENPLFVILQTYSEVLPIGLIISLISALILKKKPQ